MFSLVPVSKLTVECTVLLQIQCICKHIIQHEGYWLAGTVMRWTMLFTVLARSYMQILANQSLWPVLSEVASDTGCLSVCVPTVTHLEEAQFSESSCLMPFQSKLLCGLLVWVLKTWSTIIHFCVNKYNSICIMKAISFNARPYVLCLLSLHHCYSINLS